MLSPGFPGCTPMPKFILHNVQILADYRRPSAQPCMCPGLHLHHVHVVHQIHEPHVQRSCATSPSNLAFAPSRHGRHPRILRSQPLSCPHPHRHRQQPWRGVQSPRQHSAPPV
ncbi:hypothetical protein B0H10DRAFT_2112217 [Mycena sp. CBHHK59/15]|nr:hypothetical protein B0H10DRAFT_2112217 [Mycena sp. CBHHK59/15]